MEKIPSWETNNPQVIMKFLTFYWIQRFIAMFTRACHWSLSWDSCIHSTPTHPVSLISILMLSFCLCLGPLPSGLFPPDFLTKNFVQISHLSHACCISCPSYSPLLEYPSNVCRSIWFMKLLMQSSPTLCHFLPLRSKYTHDAMKWLNPTSCTTTVQNVSLNYILK